MACLTGAWKHYPVQGCGRKPRARLQVTASLCPYSTLGVSATADEREIKKAYRQLALKYHPDVSTIPDAHVQFVTIQQAYDLLTGKIRGKEVDFNKPSHGGWDFHDWFWQFKSSRRWDPNGNKQQAGSHHAAGAAGFTPQAEDKETIMSQLAGLRHRAAIRANMRRYPAASQEPAAQQQEQPTAQAVWDNSDMADGAQVSEGTSTQADAGTQGSSWAHAASRTFVPSEEKRGQVMDQLAGLKRRMAMRQQSKA